jgi:hypothetical protein
MSNLFTDYGYSNVVISYVEPVVSEIEKSDPAKARRIIGEWALCLSDEVEKGMITSQIADDCFTLLMLYLEENSTDIQFDEETSDLIFEGMHLHDIGRPYGTTLDIIKKLAIP